MAMNTFCDPEYSKKFLSKLPEQIQNRLSVLLQYHEEHKKLDAELDKEEAKIRAKYEQEFLPLYARRKEIVSGSSVTEEEVNGGFPEDHKGAVSLVEGEESTGEGIPLFWMTVLTNYAVLADTIQPEDELILKHLVDISSRTLPGEADSTEVVFTFSPNDFIEEPTLTITIKASEKKADEATEYVITKSPMTMKKEFLYKTVAVKGKGKKQAGKVTKVKKPVMSFFWIFMEVDEEDEDLEEVAVPDDQLLNIVDHLHNKVLPAAVKFFTGEMDGASDLDDDYEEDEEEEDEEDDER